MTPFLFAISTYVLIGENYRKEALYFMTNEELIGQLKESLEGLDPGSEEHKRVVDEIASLSAVITNDKKVDNEVIIKKEDGNKAIKVAGITAGGLLLGGIIKEGLKFIMNLNVVNGERKRNEFYEHNPYDNR